MNKIIVPGLNVHHYLDIEERNKGMAENPSDLHILKMDDGFYDIDWTCHIGEKLLFSARHSHQIGVTRIDWHPREGISKDEICMRLLKNYGEWVCSIAQGNPQIEVDIQKEYKKQGETVRIPALNAENHFQDILAHKDYNTFRGIVLWGYDHEGAYACAGLDTVYGDIWDKRGDVFVEFWTRNMGEKISKLYADTAEQDLLRFESDITKLLEFNI